MIARMHTIEKGGGNGSTAFHHTSAAEMMDNQPRRWGMTTICRMLSNIPHDVDLNVRASTYRRSAAASR